jgi:3-deoxy-D-manno-octulosonic acid kinase
MPVMTFDRLELPDGALLFDPALVSDPVRLFDLEALAARGALAAERGGRGSVSYLTLDGREFVLRRYLRGGLPAKISRDRYLWLGEGRTRAFLELRMLDELARRGLPVPRPAAARYVRSGLTYRGELVTERLQGTRSLAQRWLAGEAGEADWVAAGRCIRRFHDAGVQHADLNANNIMLDGKGGAWLLDFDRGRLREPGPWRERILARLGRSLAKIARTAGLDDDWRARFDVLKRAHDADPAG